MTEVPLVDLEFAPAEVDVKKLADGGMILSSPQKLGEYPPSLGVWLRHWARKTPDRLFLAERDGWVEAIVLYRVVQHALGYNAEPDDGNSRCLNVHGLGGVAVGCG